MKNQQEDLNSDFDKKFATSKNVPYFMFGAFIIIASCMISGSVYMMTKRRELLAFSMQQVMPVAKEGIETIAPTMSKVGKEVMEEMAPAYGEMAKEDRRKYMKNAYRVLLTRSRQGMVIYVPEGNIYDMTTLPELYDTTYEYLKSIGIEELI